MTTDRSKMIAAAITHGTAKIQFAAFAESEDSVPGAVSTFVRLAPTAEAPRPRWIKGRLDSDDYSDKDIAIGAMVAQIRRKLADTGDNFVVEGIHVLELSETDNRELDAGQAQPNSLFTRLADAYSKTPPKTIANDDLTAAVRWLLEGPIAAIIHGSDLAPFSESLMTKVVVIEKLDAEEVGGIKLQNGDVFLPFEFWDGLDNISFMRRAREKKIAVALFGEPGTGKSRCVLAAFGKVWTVMCGASTTRADIVGTWVPDGKGGYRWKDGALILAMTYKKKGALTGGVLFLDEVTQVDPKELTDSVYSVMVDGWLMLPENPDHPLLEPITDGMDEDELAEMALLSPQEIKEQIPHGIKAGADTYVVGGGNPNVPGAVMSEALLSRFGLKPEYTTNYDAAATLLGPDHEDIITVARNMEAKRQAGEVMWAPQMRDLLGYMKTADAFSVSLALSNLVANCRSESDREVLEDVIARTMGISNIKPFRI